MNDSLIWPANKWRARLEEMREFVVQELFSDEEKQYMNGYWQWFRDFHEKELDGDLEKICSHLYNTSGEQMKIATREWLKHIRRAYSFTKKEMAARLKISQKDYEQLEGDEKTGRLTIKELSRVAEAFHCELFYFFKPKHNARLSEHIYKELYEKFIHHPWVISEPQERRAKALAFTIKRRPRASKPS